MERDWEIVLGGNSGQDCRDTDGSSKGIDSSRDHSSDCCVMYRAMEDEGYSHDSKSFDIVVNRETGADMNTIESRWHQVKPSLILITESVTMCTTWQTAC